MSLPTIAGATGEMGRARGWSGRGGGQQAGRPLGGPAFVFTTGSGYRLWLAWAGCLAECLPGGCGQRGGTALDSLGKEHCPSHLSPTGQPASAASPDFLCAHRGPVLRLPVEECSQRGPSRPHSARAWHGLRSAGTLLRISRFPGQTQLHRPSKSSLLLLLPAPPR